MTYRIQLLITLAAILFLKVAFSQDLDAEIIKANRISKIVSIQKAKNYLARKEYYYNSEGKEIKSTYREKTTDDIDSSVLLSSYKNGLLSKEISREFYKRNLLLSTINDYSYQTDENGILVTKSTKVSYSDGKRRGVYKEVYRHNSSLRTDTIFYYSKDTTETPPNQIFPYLVMGKAKLLHLDKIIIQEKDSALNLTKSIECFAENDFYIDSTSSIFKLLSKVGDTSIVEDIFWSKGGCNRYRYDIITKRVQVSDLEEYTQSDYGDTTRIIDKRDRLHLTTQTKTEIKSIQGNKRIYLTTYQYFFFPDKRKIDSKQLLTKNL